MPRLVRFFVSQETDAALIDQDGFFDAAAAAFFHGGIIREMFVDQIADRQTDQRPVPVADFHGMERNLRDNAVDTLGLHCDPVTDLDQMVGIDLHTGNEGMDRMLKKENQNRGDRTQAGKEIDRAFPEQY